MSSPPQPPPAPDPVATANAQKELNKETAVTQYGLNATNQVTPTGSLEYRQIGTWGDGTPRFESTQSMSPEQQAIYDTGSANALKLGQVGGEQIDRVSDILARPVDFSGAPAMPTFDGDTSAIEGRIMDLGRKRLDPLFAERRSALDNKLSNQGIFAGDQAWDTEQRKFNEQENDAYNNLLLAGRGQGFNELSAIYDKALGGRQQGISEILAERETPINEISALLSGSQVKSPTWAQTPQSAVAPTDYSGLVQQNYGIANDQWKQEVARQNAMMGGLFGLAGAGVKAGATMYTGG